jgi:hypothetical protein
LVVTSFALFTFNILATTLQRRPVTHPAGSISAAAPLAAAGQ